MTTPASDPKALRAAALKWADGIGKQPGHWTKLDVIAAYIGGCSDAALAQRPAEPARTIFLRMEDGSYAETEAEAQLEEILGVELLGIGFDTYDGSFEIYPMENAGVAITPERHAQILALGCSRYWINYPDDTEQYCTGERRSKGRVGCWERFNRGVASRRSVRERIEALPRWGIFDGEPEPKGQMIDRAAVLRILDGETP